MNKKECLKAYSNAVISGESTKALSLIPHILPKKLYHYSSFSEFWHSKIIQGQLYLSNPATFNDPYDCRIQGSIVYFVRQYFLDHPALDARKVIPDIIDGVIQVDYKGKKMSMAEYTEIACDELKSEFHITCLSETKDSMLMWSHYAAQHSGYAIELDTKKISENPYDKIHLRKVVYDKRPITAESLIKSSNKEAFLFCKSPEWKYEKEWRFFETRENFWNVAKYISAIYLGSRFDFCKHHYEIKTIQEYCQKAGIKLFQMKIDDDTYKLYPVEITMKHLM